MGSESILRRSLLEKVNKAYYARELSERDVVVPRIIKPDAGSIWPVGSVQTVVWDITQLPPTDDEITNLQGRVILGRDTGDSLNLDFENPLAQGFHIRLGRINITVPNVPPRPDYLIVLMGNSGNTSPSFAITRIDSENPPTEPGPSLPGVAPSLTRSSPFEPTLITEPIPISGTTITGGVSPPITSWSVTETPDSGPSSSPDGSSPSPSSEPPAQGASGGSSGFRISVNPALFLCTIVGAWVLAF
ncbi:hypothetical protein FA15DRAFT_592484 [Coprinopsis marcescibilis]|uniref:Uncharacterized protein n=1 Tax=Coprinopsis marcescibilis TaxID=230819 RepID=A0A5C3KV34_COPMA|nr:hypothetical protein FA15DRAFT_592484 [Coprinopsis marcescibilis]